MSFVSTFFAAVWSVLLELAPWLLLGAFIAGVLHVVLPKNFVRRHLSGRGGVLKAVGLGVPLPLCSCGVIPAGLGLRKDGATRGASVGFLISTPQTGVDSVLVSASFLGWPFALFKVLSAGVTGLIGGWATDALVNDSEGDASEGESVDTGERSWRGLVSHADELLASIWKWLVVGVLVSAAISTFVPTEAFGAIAGLGSLGAALAVLVISLPMYVCATASVPIAAALVAGGLPPGAALVFLMAGPATNVATIGAIYRGFGAKTLAIYLITIIVGSIGFGLGFDTLLATSGTTVHTHEHTTWWAAAAAVALLALMARYLVGEVRARMAERRAESVEAPELVVPVEGMTCNGCANRLAGALRDTDGVDGVMVSLEGHEARVRGHVDRAAIERAVREAGFRVP